MQPRRVRQGCVRSAQVIVGYSRRQVVDVVIPDIAGEPAQRSGQVEERAAIDGRLTRVP